MGAIQWDRAECKNVEDWEKIFFPSPGRPKKAPPYKAICDVCPIKYTCLSYAIVHDEEGIWGGLTKNERDSLAETIRPKLLDEAIAQGWYEDRPDLDRLLTPLQPLGPEEFEVDLFDLEFAPEVAPLEYFDLPEYGEPLVQLPREPQVKEQLVAQHQYFRSGPFSGPNEFQLPPSPFDDTNLSSMPLLDIW